MVDTRTPERLTLFGRVFHQFPRTADKRVAIHGEWNLVGMETGGSAVCW